MTDLNTLLTALYVKIDDGIGRKRCLGRPPLLSDSELVCLAVAQALLGYHSESRWLRYANKHLCGMFPYLPRRAGCNKRLRSALPLVKRVIRELAMDSGFWFDNHWITDSSARHSPHLPGRRPASGQPGQHRSPVQSGTSWTNWPASPAPSGRSGPR